MHRSANRTLTGRGSFHSSQKCVDSGIGFVSAGPAPSRTRVSLRPAQRGHHATGTAINAHVPIRTKEADAPNKFPPARLFLDDIDEIVRILVDAVEKREKSIRPDKDAKITLTLTIKDQVCDDVQELPKIATKTFDLSVSIAAQAWLPDASLEFDRFGTSLGLLGFTTLQKLSIYHKLAPIFKRRNLWLATLVHSNNSLILTVLVLSGLANFALMSNKQTPSMLSHVITLLGAVASITYLATIFHHSTIILRHSSERSALRQDLLPRILPVAVGCVLTFLLTLLGFYLKHKYWP
jgi:hypothetical protein